MRDLGLAVVAVFALSGFSVGCERLPVSCTPLSVLEPGCECTDDGFIYCPKPEMGLLDGELQPDHGGDAGGPRVDMDPDRSVVDDGGDVVDRGVDATVDMEELPCPGPQGAVEGEPCDEVVIDGESGPVEVPHCVGGRWVCEDDMLVCRPDPNRQRERDDNCDGVDDNCDGQVDEDVVACTVGLGACRRAGRLCCSSASCLPLREEDYDQNGEVDPESPWKCVTGSPVGGPSLGSEPNDWPLVTPEEVLPNTYDVCNRADDDCDGFVDEYCECGVAARALQDGSQPLTQDVLLPIPFSEDRPQVTLAIPPQPASSPGGLLEPPLRCGPRASADESNMDVIRWRPAVASDSETGETLWLVQAVGTSDMAADPMLYLRRPCEPVTPMDIGAPEFPGDALACDLETGLIQVAEDELASPGQFSTTASIALGIAGDRQADPVAIIAAYHREQPGSLQVRTANMGILDGCVKELMPEGVEPRRDAAQCTKRVTVGRASSIQTPIPDPQAELQGGSASLPYCLDNNGRNRSVEVSWASLTDGDPANDPQGVLGSPVLDPADWWSTTIDPAFAAAGTGVLTILVNGSDDSPCAAQRIELKAFIGCPTGSLSAEPMPRTTTCDPLDDAGQFHCPERSLPTCDDDSIPEKALDINRLRAACPGNAEPVLHIGVLRRDRPAAMPPCERCNPNAIEACFTYRLSISITAP